MLIGVLVEVLAKKKRNVNKKIFNIRKVLVLMLVEVNKKKGTL